MAKTKTDGDTAPESLENVHLMQLLSVDQGNGIVVYTTTAEDGTGFTLLLDEDRIDATAEAGQVWFYAGRPLSETPNIRLA